MKKRLSLDDLLQESCFFMEEFEDCEREPTREEFIEMFEKFQGYKFNDEEKKEIINFHWMH